jgi:hypothetical protein
VQYKTCDTFNTHAMYISIQSVSMPSRAHSQNKTAWSVCLRTKLGSVLHMRHATRVNRTSLFYRTSEGSTSALGRMESLRIALFGTFSPTFLYAHADVDKTQKDTGIDTANYHRKNGASGIILYRYVFNRQARNTRCAMYVLCMCMHIRAHTHTHLCEKVLHPSVTSFSQLLHDAFKVHFSHQAF